MELFSSLKFLFTLLILLFISACNDSNGTKEYRIVLDAGSTSTRLYLYQYNNSSLPMNIETLLDIKEEPGISDVNTDDLNTYLTDLFNNDVISLIQALTLNENDDVQLSHIQFYSTAGMRALSDTEQNEINENIQQWLINWSIDNNINIDSTNIDVRTLSGGEEATYGWITVNYLNNYFQGELNAVADLGGESTEIAYMNTIAPNVKVRANDTLYSLSAFSYTLGTFALATLMEETDACFLTGYTPTASGDYSLCKAAITTMLETKEDISTPNANNNSQYYVISDYYYVAEAFDILNNYSLAALATAANTFCQISWETAQEQYPDSDQDYLPFYCLIAAFQVTLMNDFYLLEDNTQSFYPADDINGEKATWPIGVIVTQAYQEISE